jgi:hypothetical protein
MTKENAGLREGSTVLVREPEATPKAEPLRMRRGQFVQTWFDTGAMGATILYGVVESAGPRVYTVRWESGITNRVQQGNTNVRRADDLETASAAMKAR